MDARSDADALRRESQATAAALKGAAAQAAVETPPEGTNQAASGVIAETVGLVTAIGKLAGAEASASWRESRRAASLKLAATGAAVPAYAFLVTALILALTDWLDSAAAAFALVGALHAAAVWWFRRGAGRARAKVGFPRTRRALSLLISDQESS